MSTAMSAQAAPDNWGVEGAHGELHISGALAAGACRLDMTSLFQQVEMGVIPTATLLRPGDQGEPVAVQLQLRDCLPVGGRQRDDRIGSLTWDSIQPVVSVSFAARMDDDNPDLVQARGASGLGLRLLDSQKRDVRLGSRGAPQLLTPYNDQLTYYVVPERTRAALAPGAFRASVDFRLNYD
ncbi:type 1 fimbrial protein [Serratia proteamaculans]|uniref:Type 1 fimbrial protein n=2 Tax=Serratia proteamaculans TaxID=28151 RepID=A0A7U0NBC4_SERPR|nr:type 1 fimbrial protein [Serratia proteamaculans]QQX56016.1 type 1 fimbrial protein [Serratia proteamaculans]